MICKILDADRRLNWRRCLLVALIAQLITQKLGGNCGEAGLYYGRDG